MESCFSSRPAHPAPQGRGRPRRPLCCELASRILRMAISSWVGSGPQAYLMEVGLQNPAWREVTLAVAYGSSLEFLLYSGPQSAFPLALSPPGLPGITSGLNDSLHPTVYVSVFCFSHGYLTHWLSHGLLRLPQHAPGSLCDCPSSSVSF